MGTLGRWLIVVVLLAGAGAVYLFAIRGTAASGLEAKEAGAHEGGEEEEARSWVSHDAEGHAVLTLDHETRERIGLATTVLNPASRSPEVIAYGRLEADPARTFTVRAPLAGFLHEPPNGSWPTLGARLPDAAVVGVIKPRFGAKELLDLNNMLAEAQADVEERTAQVAAAKASFENNKELNSQGKLISDRTLEESLARLRGEEARLRAAQTELTALEDELSGLESPAGAIPLPLPLGGEVMEVSATPGEAVESGQQLLRLARFDQLLARVEVPAGEQIDASPVAARVALVGRDERVLQAEPVGPVATADARTQGQAFLLRVTSNDPRVRPGMAVKAFLALPGDAQPGALAPRSAVVRFAGLTWVYLQTGEDRFERRDVVLDCPMDAGWFVPSGVSAGDRVVTTGAQVLLSEELKAQIKREEEATE